jgi:outer membrane immunogenic protein
MKRTIFGGFVISALLVTTPLSAAIITPTMAAPVYNWTGCYVGMSGGAGGSFDSFTTQPGIGGFAGGQGGCNYQTGMLVLGIEGEGFWSNMKNANGYTYPGVNLTGYYPVKNEWDFDVAARFGLAIDRALIYGKAGVAWGNFSFGGSYSFSAPAPPSFLGVSAPDTTFAGLLIGLGLEYGITANWTAKFEYDFVDFPAKGINITLVQTSAPPEYYNETYGATKNIFKLGLNYKFELGQ